VRVVGSKKKSMTHTLSDKIRRRPLDERQRRRPSAVSSVHRWGKSASALCVATAILSIGLLIPSAASAAFVYPFTGQISGPTPSTSFDQLGSGSAAVNDHNGHIVLADSSNGLIYDFASVSDTSPEIWNGGNSTHGGSTPVGSFGGGRVAVAVDNSTGDVYVSDKTDAVIDKFDQDGNLIESFGDSENELTHAPEPDGQLAGLQTPAGVFSAAGAGAFGIAVDQATHDLYAVDVGHKVVDIFDSSGKYLRQITATPAGLYENGGYADAIAVDGASGKTYLADSGFDVVFVFDSAGTYLETWHGSNTPGGSFGGGYVSVAADNSSGDIYVVASSHQVIDVFDSEGHYLTQTSHSVGGLPKGITVDQASGKLYVSYESAVGIFAKFLIPDVTTGPANEITGTNVRLTGIVNTAGTEPADTLSDCHFDYVTKTAFESAGFSNLHSDGEAPCEPVASSIPVDATDHPVTAHLEHLTPGTAYRFRLKAVNQNGFPSVGMVESVETLPAPSITSVVSANVGASSADLNAEVNPRGYPTHYHFEWGPCATPSTCVTSPYGNSIPVPDEAIGSGTTPDPVATHLSNLQEGITYHWRVLATNPNGTEASADHTFVYLTGTPVQRNCSNEAFRTGPSAALPDCRAYELVTPPRKNGATVGYVAIGIRPLVSTDGARMIANTIQCFGGATSCPAARQVEGTPYAFERGSDGWKTIPLTLPATQVEINSAWAANPETGAALFSAPTPPTDQDDFYARAPSGNFADVGPISQPSDGGLGVNPIGGSPVEATADLSHIVWGAHPSWIFDNTTPGGGDALYEYVGVGNAQPFQVGVTGPKNSRALVSVCGADLGLGYGALSADGRTVYFVARSCSGGSAANAHVPVPADTLYARVDGELPSAHTVAISDPTPSECGAGAGSAEQTCRGAAPADAKFIAASADGSKVLFTSTRQLTDDASEGSNNLYLYDFNQPESQRLTALSAGDTSGLGPQVEGLLAITPDGSHVYFVASGVLGEGPNAQGKSAAEGENNLYLYQGGHATFVATLSGADQKEWVRSVPTANVTSNGHFLVFTSEADLTPDDSSAPGASQVFRYDAQTGQLIRLSVGERGFNDNGNAVVGGASLAAGAGGEIALATPGTAGLPFLGSTMSADGTRVFFMSPAALTPGAVDNVQTGIVGSQPSYAQNVYEWEQQGSGDCTEASGCIYLVSDGRDISKIGNGGASSVRFFGTDVTGTNVFFSTVDSLLPSDTDSNIDFYDARAEGGFPGAATVTPCQGDACKAETTLPPPAQSPGSAGFSGPEEGPGHVGKPKKPHREKSHRRHKHHKRVRSSRGGHR
jgi:hypothetical protein